MKSILKLGHRGSASVVLTCYHFLFLQEQVNEAIVLAMEQQIQKLLVETHQDMAEFDSLLQPIIDTCTKDAISVSAK